MKIVVLALVIFASFEVHGSEYIHFAPVVGGASGTGKSTRYWDCCKPSCGWSANVGSSASGVVNACSADGSTIIDSNTESGCVGGDAYTCSNQQSWAVNSTLAYGFAAAALDSSIDANLCCACVVLSFQGDLAGKQMLAQITNTVITEDSGNQFDIEIPGGGVGYYTEGCVKQWDAPSTGWGDQYGGVSSEADCSELPASLQDGCKFRFEFMEGAANPDVSFVQVDCPSDIISITGCQAPNT